MKFRLAFDCDNAAFDEGIADEVTRILAEVTRRIDNGDLIPGDAPIAIRDSNGNVIGSAQFIGRR